MALTKTPIELSSTPSIVDGGNDTAITIDSSENVLVGKTATSIGAAGHTIFASGEVFHTVAGTPLYVNRTGSDGSIQNFYKDGTTVGSIGVDNNDNFQIGATTSGHAGLYFGNGSVAPMAGNSRVQDTVDLGNATYRWKDLHLSGGAYLGGTAAANKLEDYEEGTWTPTFSVSSGAVSIFSARYTKIGRQVIINLAFQVTSAISAGNGSLVFTAPFTQFTNGTTDVGLCSVYPDGDNNNVGLVLNNSSGNNTEFVMVFKLNASFGNGSQIIGKLVYETNQ